MTLDISMSSARDLIAWLRTQIEADEARALAECTIRKRMVAELDVWLRVQIEKDEARALAECTIRKRMVAELEDMLGGDPWQEGGCAVVLAKLQASWYSEREGYRDEWRPRP